MTRILRPKNLSNSRLPEELQEVIIRVNNTLYPNYNSSEFTTDSPSSETLINRINSNSVLSSCMNLARITFFWYLHIWQGFR